VSVLGLVSFFYFFTGLCTALWQVFVEIQYVINPSVFLFVGDLFTSSILFGRAYVSLFVFDVDRFLALFDEFLLSFKNAVVRPSVVLFVDAYASPVSLFFGSSQTLILFQKFLWSWVCSLCPHQIVFFDKEALVRFLSEGWVGRVLGLFAPC
jgi:hypothetical protein